MERQHLNSDDVKKFLVEVGDKQPTETWVKLWDSMAWDAWSSVRDLMKSAFPNETTADSVYGAFLRTKKTTLDDRLDALITFLKNGQGNDADSRLYCSNILSDEGFCIFSDGPSRWAFTSGGRGHVTFGGEKYYPTKLAAMIRAATEARVVVEKHVSSLAKMAVEHVPSPKPF